MPTHELETFLDTWDREAENTPYDRRPGGVRAYSPGGGGANPQPRRVSAASVTASGAPPS